jgi:hypothetical protein
VKEENEGTGGQKETSHTHGRDKKCANNLSRKPKWKGPVGTPVYIWEGTIKINSRIQWCQHDDEPSGTIKGEDCLNCLDF